MWTECRQQNEAGRVPGTGTDEGAREGVALKGGQVTSTLGISYRFHIWEITPPQLCSPAFCCPSRAQRNPIGGRERGFSGGSGTASPPPVVSGLSH